MGATEINGLELQHSSPVISFGTCSSSGPRLVLAGEEAEPERKSCCAGELSAPTPLVFRQLLQRGGSQTLTARLLKVTMATTGFKLQKKLNKHIS